MMYKDTSFKLTTFFSTTFEQFCSVWRIFLSAKHHKTFQTSITFGKRYLVGNKIDGDYFLYFLANKRNVLLYIVSTYVFRDNLEAVGLLKSNKLIQHFSVNNQKLFL